MSQKVFSYGAGVLFAAAGAACWSMAGGLVRLTHGVDAWQIVFFRSTVVLVCMLLWLGLRFRGDLGWRMRDAGVNAIIAGVAIGTAGLVFIIAMFYTTVADAVFMTGVSPFLSAILGLWILRERIPAITWIAMCVAMIGMGVIFYGNAGGGAFVGTLLALYSAFCFSCYAVMLRWGQKTDMSVALIWNAIYLVMVVGLVILIPTGLRATHGVQDFAIGWQNFGLCFVMGAVQLTLGLILFTIGSRSVPAAQLALIALVEPTLSPLWAWLASGELPPVWTFIGGAVIVGAIVIQALFATRNRRHAGKTNLQRASESAFDHP
ncbi:MAG: DMT family transporter [Alphaproteobacteria bacterium]|nr:DMT family transporter [Alphaproteobacteria bacterium]